MIHMLIQMKLEQACKAILKSKSFNHKQENLKKIATLFT